MSRSITRFGNLNKVFKNGDSDLLNEIGALCIIFEDFRHEFASLMKLVPDPNEKEPVIEVHKALYYVRRSLITLEEARARLHAISTNNEFRAGKDWIPERFYSKVIAARRFINKNVVLSNFRNYMGAHVDPEKVVQSSIRYLGPNAVASIGWDGATRTDFALKLDFVHYILEGAMASNLPGGVETLGDELPRFMDVMNKAFVHLADATFSLVYVFLWDKFGA